MYIEALEWIIDASTRGVLAIIININTPWLIAACVRGGRQRVWQWQCQPAHEDATLSAAIVSMNAMVFQ